MSDLANFKQWWTFLVQCVQSRAPVAAKEQPVSDPAPAPAAAAATAPPKPAAAVPVAPRVAVPASAPVRLASADPPTSTPPAKGTQMTNDLANLFKPNWADQSNPIPGLLQTADGSLVTLRLIELTAQPQLDQLQMLHDKVLVPADSGAFSWAAERAIEDNLRQRKSIDSALRAVSGYRRLVLNWRVNVAAGQLQTHNASNFPALPQSIADYLGTLSVA